MTEEFHSVKMVTGTVERTAMCQYVIHGTCCETQAMMQIPKNVLNIRICISKQFVFQ